MNDQPVQLPNDIRGLVPNPPPWWSYAVLALASLALAVAAVWLYRWWKTRRPAAKTKAGASPWETLRARLQAMTVPSDFPEGRCQEEYFYGLSLLLREAIELRTRIPATDRTFQELRDPLRKKLPLATLEVQAVLAFLERADLVKFASAASTKPEAAACQLQVSAWVQKLEPKAGELSHWDGERSIS